MKTKLLAEIQYYLEILTDLCDLKAFVSDLKMKIDLVTGEFGKKWDEYNNYYQAIIRSGNLLENSSELDRDTLIEYYQKLVPSLE